MVEMKRRGLFYLISYWRETPKNFVVVLVEVLVAIVVLSLMGWVLIY